MLEGGVWSNDTQSSLPWEVDTVPIVQEAGRASRPVWTGAENPYPPLGFNPWTVQPTASRYSDYAILALA